MNSIVAVIIGAILRSLPDDLLKSAVAGFINHLEAKIEGDGKQNWEDSAVLPLLEALKKQLGIATVAAPAAPTAEGSAA